MTRAASAYVWRGYLDGRAPTHARLQSWSGPMRLRLRIRLRRATLAAIRDASTRAEYRRRWWGHSLDRGRGYDWPESRTHLADFAAWLRGAR